MKTPRADKKSKRKELERAILQTGAYTRMTALQQVWLERPELRDAVTDAEQWERIVESREAEAFLDYLDRTYGRLNLEINWEDE